jgi:hypothetical protein
MSDSDGLATFYEQKFSELQKKVSGKEEKGGEEENKRSTNCCSIGSALLLL